MEKFNQKLRDSFVTTGKISAIKWPDLGRELGQMASHSPFQTTLLCDFLTAEPSSVIQLHNKRSFLIKKNSHYLIQKPRAYG